MREWTAMHTRRDIQTCNLAAEYRTRFAAPSSPEQKKQEQRKAEAAIVKAHQPEDFGVWRRQKKPFCPLLEAWTQIGLHKKGSGRSV